LPVFDETYIDNGYMDMYQLAKTIAKSGYTGSLILDHLPRMNTSYGEGSALAYSFGYLKCMFDRAYDELNNDWLER
jgi:mannonate dehydratase